MAMVLAGGLLGLIALARSGSLLFYRAMPSRKRWRRSAGRRWSGTWLPVIGLLLLVPGPDGLGRATLDRGAAPSPSRLLQPQGYIQAVLEPRGGTP